MNDDERLAGILAVAFHPADPFLYPAEHWLAVARRLRAMWGVTVTIEPLS